MVAQTQVQPTAATAALRISHAPRPHDIRLYVHVEPDAALGCIDIQLGFGRGSAGRGQRIADDAVLYVATLRRIAAHLLRYAADYAAAADADM